MTHVRTQIDDIPFFELTLVWNPMTDNFVHRPVNQGKGENNAQRTNHSRTQALRELPIVQWTRVRSSLNRFLMHNSIDLVCELTV